MTTMQEIRKSLTPPARLSDILPEISSTDRSLTLTDCDCARLIVLASQHPDLVIKLAEIVLNRNRK